MNVSVLYFPHDPAGSNIAKAIGEGMAVKEIKAEKGLLYCEDELKDVSADFIAFASKHKSESGSPAFTVHVPGNWSSADMGGKPKEVSDSDPLMMKAIAVSLEKARREHGIDIGVGMEVDHHGPLCRIPCAFVEIGSTEKEWPNAKYAAAVAEAVMGAEEAKEDIDAKEIAFGIGGGHYCPAFNRMEIEGNTAFAHVMPNYAADAVESDAFMRAFERTTEEIDVVLIDWKGLKAPQREKMLKLINEAGAEWRKA